MRFFALLFLFCVSTLTIKADTGDSLHILLPTDTVIISVNEDFQKIIVHKIAPKQTIYRISQFYGINALQIKALNPKLNEQNLSPGDEIIIPLPNRAIKRFQGKNFRKKDFLPLYYRVKKGDTAYGIANRYFKQPVDTLVARNKLKQNPISVGQLLMVGWISLKGVTKAKGGSKKNHPLSGKSYHYKKIFLEQSAGKEIKTQKGAAYWNKSASKGTKLYALHNQAKTGSMLQVTNPMTKTTVYVKVIGRINPKVTPPNVQVVLSPAAANFLGAINAKFYSEVSYY